MKKMVLALSLALGLLTVGTARAINTNNFYFSDFTGDYYLSKDVEGISHLKVVEKVTAVFPDYDQNKGICRQIAYTNQDGANVTLPSLTRSDLTLLRNGEPEPIYSIEKGDGYYNVCTGTDEYLRGEQVYTFEYEFQRVVTDFRDYQELYWDTNGNGARQRFEKVTARLHAEDGVLTGESWCYVGKYGESGQERCKITRLEDGFKFEAENLMSLEGLTFDAEITAGTFVVPEPEKDYTYVWLTVLLGGASALVIGFAVRKFMQSREKANYYKGMFVKPEYQPNKEYSLPEMAEVYLGKKKDVKVAMLLELIVQHKVKLIRGEKKKKWSLEVVTLEGVGEEYVDLLAILNGGTRPKEGEVIEVKRQTANSKLVALKKSMDKKILENLKKNKLFEEGK